MCTGFVYRLEVPSETWIGSRPFPWFFSIYTPYLLCKIIIYSSSLSLLCNAINKVVVKVCVLLFRDECGKVLLVSISDILPPHDIAVVMSWHDVKCN